MGRKYYEHPSATVSEGKAHCTYCGAELPVDEKGMPSLRTDFPCSVSLPIPFDEEVEIRVWDCKATVYVNNKKIDYDSLPMEVAEELKRLAKESVWEAGGAINWSGIYPPSEELVQFVQELKAKGLI